MSYFFFDRLIAFLLFVILPQIGFLLCLRNNDKRGFFACVFVSLIILVVLWLGELETIYYKLPITLSCVTIIVLSIVYIAKREKTSSKLRKRIIALVLCVIAAICVIINCIGQKLLEPDLGVGIIVLLSILSFLVIINSLEKSKKLQIQLRFAMVIGIILLAMGVIIAISGFGAINRFFIDTFGFWFYVGTWTKNGIVDYDTTSLIVGGILAVVGATIINLSRTLKKASEIKKETQDG